MANVWKDAPNKTGQGLTELPPWQPGGGVETQPGEVLRWSGLGAPPAIGARVTVRMNGFGPGVVVAYFHAYGYLGVEVKCDRLPTWYVKQESGAGKSGIIRNPHVYGTELSEEDGT